HMVTLSRLRDKGVPETDEHIILTISSKLPPIIRRELADYLVEQGESITHAKLVKKISERIETMEMDVTLLEHLSPQAPNELSDSYGAIHVAYNAALKTGHKPRGAMRSPLAYSHDLYRTEFMDPITKVTLPGYYAPGKQGINLRVIPRSFPMRNEEPYKCEVCAGAHNALRCGLSSSAFRDKAKDKGLCPLCVRKHHITECRSRFRCCYCNGLHHSGGCPLKEFYRDVKNYPKDAPPRVTFFRAQAKQNEH
uniref:CCHC-type domain-containing protein n=1 Tax=Caenorhabditis tropicalis TaxID=1561998 RepID=A0A1I7V4I8_9PELO